MAKAMSKKTRRFDEGGSTTPDFSRLTFKEAFQAARGGPNATEPMNKTFMWNGTKYSTKTDEGKKGPISIPGKIGSMDKGIPVSSSKKAEKTSANLDSGASSAKPKLSDEVGNLTSAVEKRAKYEKNIRDKAFKKRLEEEDKPVEGVHPEMLLPFGRVAKGIASLASMAKSSKKPVETKKREPTMESREEVARRPKDMEESRMADEGGPNYKRGGKVKKMASGGSTRSASSRADGCAIRGKTRA